MHKQWFEKHQHSIILARDISKGQVVVVLSNLATEKQSVK